MDSYDIALRTCTVTRLESTLKAFALKNAFQITPFEQVIPFYGHSWPQTLLNTSLIILSW